MNKIKLQMIELILIFATAITTVITQPSLPLLAIPFLLIISMRIIFLSLEESCEKNGVAE